MLNASPSKLSKEPRPVYAAELDVLGFDRYWQYEPQLDAPYLWAEANAYYYRGVLVAKLRGGDVYTAPEIDLMKDEEGTPLLPKSTVLHPVDIRRMVEKNCELLGIVEQTTAKKIVAVYEKYQKKLDCFHVAFSGGKDSCVLLDLVKKALPQGSFVVVFGDTGMEFPDTYALVDAVEADCKREGIPFYRAKSHFTPQESWKLFGPPSRTLRWCCSVHKSTPQVLKLREITGKTDYRGLAFVGVRADESARRAGYSYFIYGDKVKGQYGFFPILEWTSAEVFLYIYAHNIWFNKTYKKGNARAGCLECPMSSHSSEFVRHSIYQKETKQYYDLIQEKWEKDFSDKTFRSFINHGDWKHRSDGRFIYGVTKRYWEEVKDGKYIFTIKNPVSDYQEWMKTLDWDVSYQIEYIPYGYRIYVKESDMKENPFKAKIFRQVFHKAAYCSGCNVCASNCRYGCISFLNGNVKITDCHHCYACHDLPSGCLMFDSLKIPTGGKKMRSINAFGAHGPKQEWLRVFFDNGNRFFSENNLAAPQILKFKLFLRDAGIGNNLRLTPFGKMIRCAGWESEDMLALMLVNLAEENPQFAWYIKKMDLDAAYSRKKIIEMLQLDGLKQRSSEVVATMYRRIVSTSFGTVLNFGHVTEKGELVRTKCVLSDPRVLLYGLFKFAEKCGDYKGFTLSTLLNDTIDRDGISPTRIFGLTREETKPMLRGLSARYPKFIDAAFTHDLEKITLSADKSSADVLTLFEGEEA